MLVASLASLSNAAKFESTAGYPNLLPICSMKSTKALWLPSKDPNLKSISIGLVSRRASRDPMLKAGCQPPDGFSSGSKSATTGRRVARRRAAAAARRRGEREDTRDHASHRAFGGGAPCAGALHTGRYV